ncbi:uncharacterized protein V1513DRAFT_439951 [Lipomyces chichibuensis]|uniref:uncharacterized protein n=1 Tax=Lipomyces chichibuensis TaxID=1546026 RepID=UPI0033438051
MTTPYHRPPTEPQQLSPALVTQLQYLFYEKYGLRPSGTYWITPVYGTKLPSAKRSIAAPALLYGRLEQFFLDDDLRRTIPPLQPQGVDQTLDSVNLPPTKLQYYYQNNGDDTLREQDLVGCVRGSNFVPDGIATMRSTTITGPVTFQIAEVQEIGISRSEQLRKIEEAINESGDSGRKVVRDVPAEGEHAEEINANGRLQNGTAMANGLQFHTFSNTQPSKARSPIVGKKFCKVLLQDPLGRCYWALESKPINNLEVGLKLGTKLTLSNFTVWRGVIMLKPTSVVIHGGAIDEWNTDFTVKLMCWLKQQIGLEKNEPPPNSQNQLSAPTGRINDPEIIGDNDDDDDNDYYYFDDDLDDLDFETL